MTKDKWFRSALYLREVTSKRKLLPCLWNSSGCRDLAHTCDCCTLFSWCSLISVGEGEAFSPGSLKHTFFLYASRSLNFLSLHCAQQEKDCIHYFTTSHRQWKTRHRWCQSVHSMPENQPTSAQSLHGQNQNCINNKILKTLPSMELPTHPHTPHHGLICFLTKTLIQRLGSIKHPQWFMLLNMEKKAL